MNISNPAELTASPNWPALEEGKLVCSPQSAHPSLFLLCPPAPPLRRFISTTTYPTKTVKKKACLAAHCFKAKGTTNLPLQHRHLSLLTHSSCPPPTTFQELLVSLSGLSQVDHHLVNII